MKSSGKAPLIISLAALAISAIVAFCIAYEKWLEPGPGRLIMEGNAHLENGAYEKARRCYDKALEFNVNDPNVLRDKGYALLNLAIGNEDVRIIRYSDGEKLVDYFFEHYRFQRTAASRTLFERALQCFVEAKTLKPQDPEIALYCCGLGFYVWTGPDPIKCFEKTMNLIENLPSSRKRQKPVKAIRDCAWYALCMAYQEYGQEAPEECSQELRNRVKTGSVQNSAPRLRP